jgi:hypothetical protein
VVAGVVALGGIMENKREEGPKFTPLPNPTPKPILTDEDYHAFRSAFGGWADADTDSLKKAIYESRRTSRPPVSL